MKNILALSVFAALFTITMACERDTEMPNITIVSHSEMNMVWNTETIQLSVEDDIGVVKVEFFVDGALVSTINSSPWEVQWNTVDYPDDTVTISLKAYDEVGNASREVSLNLVIQNILLTMTIEEGALWEDEDHIEILKCPVYLTASDGTLLGWAIMGNGETEFFMRPAGFDEELFDLARGYFYHRTDDPNYFDGNLYTYMDMFPGELTIEADEDGEVRGDYLGTSYFTSGNISPDDHSVLSYGSNLASGDIHTDSARVYVYEHSRQAYFYLRENYFSGGYSFYRNLQPDQVYQIYSEDLSSFMTYYYIDYPSLQFDYISAYVYAFQSQGNYNPDYEYLIYHEYIFPEGPSEMEFHYPAGADTPGDFHVQTYTYMPDDIRHYYSRYGPLSRSYSSLDVFIYDISVALPGPIQVQSSGSADIQHASISIEEGDNLLEIFPRGPVGPLLRIPRLPSEIQNQYNIPAITNSNLTDVYFYLTEHNDKEGYYPLVNSWSMMQSLEPYYSSGTEVKEIRYEKYYGSEKKAIQMVPGQPGSMGLAEHEHRVTMEDGPVKH
jgi:hypothetical protein